jgi:hypothetical protein
MIRFSFNFEQLDASVRKYLEVPVSLQGKLLHSSSPELFCIFFRREFENMYRPQAGLLNGIQRKTFRILHEI